MHKIGAGHLQKMGSQWQADRPVVYTLSLGDALITLNDYLDHEIEFVFTGRIHCIHCGRSIRKTFQQGYCYPCMTALNECNLCLVRPERCLVETGTCPTDNWAHAQCHPEHVVYFANSSGLKVGITRSTNCPTRWIDQGAVQALPIYTVENRYQSGLVEVALKPFMSDKTNWRAMLQGSPERLDLKAARDELLQKAAPALRDLLARYPAITLIDDASEVVIDYPVLVYPTTIKSFNFDKTPKVHGKLVGIKGQYLIFEKGVINLRKFGGYEVTFSADV